MEKKQNRNSEIMNLIKYTDQAFEECFPDATDEQYFNYLTNDDQALVRFLEKERNIHIAGVRNVIIDEEYFEWLQKQTFENTSENRLAYGHQLSDAEVIRLWRKNDMEQATLVRFLPLVIMSTGVLSVQNVPLSSESEDRIIQILANSLNLKKEQVYIHKELIGTEQCTEEFADEDFYEAANNYFVKGEKEEFSNLRFLRKQTNQTMMFRFLPIAINDFENAVQTRKEFFDETWETRELPEVSIKSWGDFVCAELGQEVKVVPFSYTLDQMEIEGFCEDFLEVLETNAKEKGVNVTRAK